MHQFARACFRGLAALVLTSLVLLSPSQAHAQIDRSQCKQYGGTVDCWMPIVSNTWNYSVCWEINAFPGTFQAMCLAEGGTWDGANCLNLPSTELRRPAFDGDIRPFAIDITKAYRPECSEPTATPYVWGTPEPNSSNCYGGPGASYALGYEWKTNSSRFNVNGDFNYSGQCTTYAPVDTFIAYRTRQVACPGYYHEASGGQDWTYRPTTGAEPALCSLSYVKPFNPAQPNCPGKHCPDWQGNPIDPITGVKQQIEVDYVGTGPFPLRFERVYQNRGYVLDGKFWRHNYSARIEYHGFGTVPVAIAHRPRGQAFMFSLSGGQFVAKADVDDRLTKLTDGGGALTGWEYYAAANDDIETYDADGRLTSIRNRAGSVQTLEYSTSGTPPSVAKDTGLLVRVTDPFGRQLNFTYDAVNRIATMQDPAGQTYSYTYNTGYDTTNVLHALVKTVTYPDTKTRTYLYNVACACAPDDPGPGKLIGIIDENNSQYAYYRYGDNWSSVVNQSKHAGDVGTVTIGYGNWPNSVTVTDALGTVRTYAYEKKNDVYLNNAITQPAVGGGTVSATKNYDANGNVMVRKDFNGNRTNYSYDLTRNLETSRTEGLTSAGGVIAGTTRTIETQWHPSLRIPTQVTDKDSGGAVVRVTNMTHDANGNVLTRTVSAGANSRTWTYTYNGNGSVLTVNGPRTDVPDITTYTYYANNDPDLGKRGNAATITNALGHVTSITAYNAHGQPLTVVDANGLTTTLTYDQRQRLKTRDVGGELTTYDYDGVGQLTKVTLPDESFLSYTYDAAHRLTAIQDNLGNRIAYTLDAMGNRTLEEVRDPGNQLAQTRSRVYNSLNRLFQELGALSQTTEYAYDNQGNVTSVKDPLNHITGNQYDALNRLKQVTDPNTGVTQYAYNPLDALTQVSDPRTLATTYNVDGLGNLNQLASPDTGTTVNTHDAAGNLATQTDAKSQVTTYSYDALNRVTLITFHDGSKQIYAYDQGANGLGRLSSIEERNPSNQVVALTQYVYDQKGRVTSDTRTVNGIPYATGYSYDGSGRLSSVTYPSGRTVTYAFDALGRVNQVTTTKDALQQVVVQNVQYHPFGGVKSFTLGNGQIYSRTIDTDGRIAAYTLGAASYSIGFDAASRITGISEVGNPPNSNTYGYDVLDRLTSAVLPSTNYGYGYDAVGNRQTRTVGAATDTYAYGAGSNRISSITPASGPVRNFVFDANGSTTADGLNTYAYDTRGRMVQATGALGATDYQVNALGQRIRKANVSGGGVFHYDSGGRLIAENAASGVLKREYLYLGDIPVGVVIAP